MAWSDVFVEMKTIYAEGIAAAVRSQRFIKVMHSKLAAELAARLTPLARGEGVSVTLEAPVHGSFKDKNVDVAVVHPVNGPLMLIGVRSQMTSVGKNILTYTQDIIGEAVSLQDRFPMSVFAYTYLLPLVPSDLGVPLDHERYARIFRNISGRGGPTYKADRGRYDHFAFALVDFNSDPPQLREDLVCGATSIVDLRLTNLVDRCIATFAERNPWLEYFYPAATPSAAAAVAPPSGAIVLPDGSDASTSGTALPAGSVGGPPDAPKDQLL